MKGEIREASGSRARAFVGVLTEKKRERALEFHKTCPARARAASSRRTRASLTRLFLSLPLPPYYSWLSLGNSFSSLSRLAALLIYVLTLLRGSPRCTPSLPFSLSPFYFLVVVMYIYMRESRRATC